MNDSLDIFSDSDPEPATERSQPMTDDQRARIRSLFSALSKTTAREQFALVEELIAVRITRVTELTSPHASLLIERLGRRVKRLDQTHSGNSWADREEDTWIDRL